jgi:hypothetical protein
MDQVPRQYKDLIGREMKNFVWESEIGILFRIYKGKRRAFVTFESSADLVERNHIGDGHAHALEVYRKMKDKV